MQVLAGLPTRIEVSELDHDAAVLARVAAVTPGGFEHIVPAGIVERSILNDVCVPRAAIQSRVGELSAVLEDERARLRTHLRSGRQQRPPVRIYLDVAVPIVVKDMINADVPISVAVVVERGHQTPLHVPVRPSIDPLLDVGVSPGGTVAAVEARFLYDKGLSNGACQVRIILRIRAVVGMPHQEVEPIVIEVNGFAPSQSRHT